MLTASVFESLFKPVLDWIRDFQGVLYIVLTVAVLGIGISLLTEHGRKKIMPNLIYIVIGFVLAYGAVALVGTSGSGGLSDTFENAVANK